MVLYDLVRVHNSYLSQVILRPSTSNSIYLSTPSPACVVDSRYSVQSPPENVVNQQTEVVNIISQEVLVPETSKMYYENCGNMTYNNYTDNLKFLALYLKSVIIFVKGKLFCKQFDYSLQYN